MDKITEIKGIAVIIRDIAVTIAAVLLIISMVHYDGNHSYLGLPISNDKRAYDGGYKFKVDISNSRVYHKNSCVNGDDFRN